MSRPAIHRQPDADRRAGQAAVGAAVGDRAAQPFGKAARFFLAQPREDADEFLAADPADQILGAELRRGRSSATRLSTSSPVWWPKPSLIALEVVDVEHQQRHHVSPSSAGARPAARASRASRGGWRARSADRSWPASAPRRRARPRARARWSSACSRRTCSVTSIATANSAARSPASSNSLLTTIRRIRSGAAWRANSIFEAVRFAVVAMARKLAEQRSAAIGQYDRARCRDRAPARGGSPLISSISCDQSAGRCEYRSASGRSRRAIRPAGKWSGCCRSAAFCSRNCAFELVARQQHRRDRQRGGQHQQHHRLQHQPGGRAARKRGKGPGFRPRS